MAFSQWAHKIVIFFNCLTMLAGIVMIAGAAYVYEEPAYSNFFSTESIWLAGAAGILIFLLSFLGCWAAHKRFKKILGFYMLLVLGVLILQIIGAVFYADYLGYVNIANNSGFAATNLKVGTQDIQIEVNNVVLSAYTTCCSGCPTVAQCTTTTTNTTYCPLTPPACSFVYNCNITASSTQACYKNPATIPTNTISSGECAFLADTPINSSTKVTLVGPPSAGSCGGGNPLVFQQQVSAYAASKLTWVIIICGIVAALEFLLIISTIAMLCAKPVK